MNFRVLGLAIGAALALMTPVASQAMYVYQIDHLSTSNIIAYNGQQAGNTVINIDGASGSQLVTSTAVYEADTSVVTLTTTNANSFSPYSFYFVDRGLLITQADVSSSGGTAAIVYIDYLAEVHTAVRWDQRRVRELDRRIELRGCRRLQRNPHS
jgi:hypothetical protein